MLENDFSSVLGGLLDKSGSSVEYAIRCTSGNVCAQPSTEMVEYHEFKTAKDHRDRVE